ncbi:DUF1627 domain-containing protein [Maritalea mobilis]|uniref:DUF1627 domain-containing protein n=1 Tax=Maritalea mobilis TaxID=483324 RepID=UPI001C9420BD|nr:DUF1627 domain-containing protein [Maritalea mobilis]MBY6201947.1 DUF1627 domain-containing protein [Maritalea mobilis]
MSDDSKPTTLDLGLYARGEPEGRITLVEIVAAILSLIWLAAVVVFGFRGDAAEGSAGIAGMVLSVLAVLLPVALIWVAAMAARTARALRHEATRLQASIDAMRASYVEQQQKQAFDIRPDLVRKLDELVANQEAAAAAGAGPATFTSMRSTTPAETRAAVAPLDDGEDTPQPALALAMAQNTDREPISVADFIKALNFPENEHDKEGFRTLRRALEDRGTERLIRASQDVLTLLSQDGIYMDDLRPDRSRPEFWRRFAQGERGRAIAALGGIHDRSSLVLAAGRMKKDPVFRDAAHHFLRHFDRTFMEFEKNASDEEIARLADTRTARAFMLLGRVTGTFD